MNKSKLILTQAMTASHEQKLKHWVEILNEVMPEYFFTAFSAERVHKLMPALFNIENQEGIQQISSDNSVILVYLKSAENNIAATARLMKNHDIHSASIHESTNDLVINGMPRKLVIEYYVTDKAPVKLAPLYSRKEVKNACRSLFGTCPSGIEEIYSRINWDAVADLSIEKICYRLKKALTAQQSDRIELDIEKAGGNELRLTMAFSNCPGKGFYYKIAECLNQYGFDITRRYSRNITFQQDVSDFKKMPVTVNTTYIRNSSGKNYKKKLEEMLLELPNIKWTDMEDIFYDELVKKLGWSMSEANIIRAACEFIHSQLSFIDRNAYSLYEISRLSVLYDKLLKDFIKFFDLKFRPGKNKKTKALLRIEKKINTEIRKINTGMREKDKLLKCVFSALLDFFRNIRKTNFYVKEKSALSFRMDPAFMDFYSEISSSYTEAFPEVRPYGVFYFYNSDTIGYQIRFANIARGGWRTVIPETKGRNLEKMDFFGFTKDEIFREVYVLAHTQHLKNKDIYEGGSKMICLLRQENGFDIAELYKSQRSICRAFMDLINYDSKDRLVKKEVVDLLGKKEIIEIGPDENMHDAMINWMGEYAEKVGYTLGGGLISGKPETGFNHKDYGVTSLGVHQYLLKTLCELGIDPLKDKFSVKISGGPFGDVAGNELKLLLGKENGEYIYPNLEITAVTDGPAAVYDPLGLDRRELASMIKKDNLDKFDPEKLKGEGACMVYSEPVVEGGIEHHVMFVVEKGKLRKKQITRDEFMEVFQLNIMRNYADIFIPCGGRPSTINESNWEQYFPGNKPSSKAIVEGANSFITPGARNLIQDRGVWIIKDASANKCGVITSSYEILSGLILGKGEFLKQKDKLAGEVLEILKERAEKEADWLFFQFRKTNSRLTELTESLSYMINSKNSEISKYVETHPELISAETILSHLPPAFRKMSVDIEARLPKDYKRAIVSVELACRIVYNKAQGLETEIAEALKIEK